MNSIKGTETEKNLIRSFIGESQARMKYDYFSEEAKREGYEQISEIFTETALNEKEHARIFFNFLEGNDIEIPILSDAGNIGTTMQNLEISAKGENEEWEILYPKFTKIAEKEGFKEVAFAFEMISRVEKAHEERFRKLYDNLKSEKVFKADEYSTWKCRQCGYLHKGNSALESCPTCKHSKSYFEIKETNY